MIYRRPQLINGEVYHVASRSVGDTIIFDDEKDFYRGIFSIYEFNNVNPVSIRDRREQRKAEKLLQLGKLPRRPTSGQLNDLKILDKRDKFVDILAFSFMSNHLHLILK